MAVRSTLPGWPWEELLVYLMASVKGEQCPLGDPNGAHVKTYLGISTSVPSEVDLAGNCFNCSVLPIRCASDETIWIPVNHYRGFVNEAKIFAIHCCFSS